jgi:hypothetical protein
MYKYFIRSNLVFLSVILFVLLFGIINYIKPLCFFNKDGSIRDFGVGYKNKTILPIWLLSIILGILCYLILFYYVNM